MLTMLLWCEWDTVSTLHDFGIDKVYVSDLVEREVKLSKPAARPDMSDPIGTYRRPFHAL